MVDRPMRERDFSEKVAPGVSTPPTPFSKDVELPQVFRSSSMKVLKNQSPRNDSPDRPYMPSRGLNVPPNRTLYDPKKDEQKQRQIRNAQVPKDTLDDLTQDARPSMSVNDVVEGAHPPSKPGPKRDFTTLPYQALAR